MADTKSENTTEKSPKPNNKKLVFVILGCGLIVGLCVVCFVFLSVLGLNKARENSEEVREEIEQIENEINEAEEEASEDVDSEPIDVTITELAKCDGSFQGEKVRVTGYFQTPFSVFCYGTCSLDFASKFDAPDGTDMIKASVDYTEDDGENTVTFPDSYTDITDFTFLDENGAEINSAKAATIVGVWQFTDNSDDDTAENTCRLSVDTLIQ
ncbi:hypothetical protein GF389_04860 [Candidatus Dojkabacteria bacterium]|nr:hypothetical protein [Candidatus Dojkabacteria bacterium]